MPRKLVKARIKFLSLVPKGANRLKAIYKEDGTLEFNPLIKAAPDFDEKGELLAVVYVPNFLDSQGEYADAEVIKEAAYGFAKDKGNIDIRHNEEALPPEDIFVAESFIIQKDDPRFSEFPVEVTGGWGVVIKIENEEIKKLYREGKWEGISMGGTGIRQEAPQEELKSLLKELISELQPMPIEEKDVKKLIEENNDTLLKEMKKIVGKEEKNPIDEVKDLLKELVEKKVEKKEEKKESLADKLRARREELLMGAIEKAITEDEDFDIEKLDAIIEKIEPKKKKSNRLTNLGLFGDNNEESYYEGLGKSIAKEANEGKL